MPDVYFECSAGGGNGGATLEVSYGEEFYNKTLTATNGTKTLTKTATSSGSVIFKIPESGNWTVSGVVDGTTYSVSESIVLEYSAELASGFDYKAWLVAAGVDPTSYATLSSVLSDEELIRKLMTIHASVDYMASFAAVNADLETVLYDDHCAKWINLRDYALDNMYANAAIKTAMDTADKYGYGEWVITDNTTTPPTWGAKGNVPVMTSNSAPYGEVSANNYDSSYYAWKAFDGDDTSYWRSSDVPPAWIAYKFVTPICVKRIKIKPGLYGSGLRVLTYKVQGSNTGDTNDYTDIYSGSLSSADEQIVNITNNNYYLYYRVYVLTATEQASAGIISLQFYGRSLDVSVPVMTSNTAPYGVASTNSYTSNHEAYRAFDSDDTTYWQAVGNYVHPYIEYEFDEPKCVKMLTIKNRNISTNNTIVDFTFKGSNDGNTYEDIVSLTNDKIGASESNAFIINNNKSFKRFRVDVSTVIGTDATLASLQFYGLDYSEKEFETGTTRKWLYDHGVELETIVNSTTGASSIAEKRADELYISVASATQANASMLSSQDLTGYNLLRAKFTDANSNGGILGVYSTTTPTGSTSSDASATITAPINDRNNKACDISSFDQTKAVGIRVSNGSSSAARYLAINELWVE